MATKKKGMPACPKCKIGEAHGTLEELTGVARIFEDEGKIQYTGDTNINWDDQKSVVGPNGELMLQCGSCGSVFEAPEGFKVGD